MNEIYVFICSETEIYALLYFLHSQKIAPTHRPTTFINHKQNHVYVSARAQPNNFIFHRSIYTSLACVALFSRIFKSSKMEGGVKASLERAAKNGSFAPKCSDFVNFGPHYLQRRGTTYSVTRSVAGARADQQRAVRYRAAPPAWLPACSASPLRTNSYPSQGQRRSNAPAAHATRSPFNLISHLNWLDMMNTKNLQLDFFRTYSYTHTLQPASQSNERAVIAISHKRVRKQNNIVILAF